MVISHSYFFYCILLLKFAIGEEILDNDNKKDKKSSEKGLSGFILSKWETVDPEQVEAQAMTTSKWDLLENSTDNPDSSQNDHDSNDYSDARYVELFNLLYEHTEISTDILTCVLFLTIVQKITIS